MNWFEGWILQCEPISFSLNKTQQLHLFSFLLTSIIWNRFALKGWDSFLLVGGHHHMLESKCCEGIVALKAIKLKLLNKWAWFRMVIWHGRKVCCLESHLMEIVYDLFLQLEVMEIDNSEQRLTNYPWEKHWWFWIFAKGRAHDRFTQRCVLGRVNHVCKKWDYFSVEFSRNWLHYHVKDFWLHHDSSCTVALN